MPHLVPDVKWFHFDFAPGDGQGRKSKDATRPSNGHLTEKNIGLIILKNDEGPDFENTAAFNVIGGF